MRVGEGNWHPSSLFENIKAHIIGGLHADDDHVDHANHDHDHDLHYD